MIHSDVTSFEAFIFDMDGTLVDNMDFHRRTWLEWAPREGLNLTEEEILSQTHGTIGEIVARFFPDRTPEELFQIGERKEALYRQIYEPHLRLLPGLGEFLDSAKQHHMPCALATAGNTTNINFITNGLGIRSYFSVFVGGDDVTHGKPHPEVFLTAARELAIAPEKCLVFEDSPAGVEAAHRAGMKCVALNLMNPRADFGEAPHVIQWVNDYRDLISA